MNNTNGSEVPKAYDVEKFSNLLNSLFCLFIGSFGIVTNCIVLAVVIVNSKKKHHLLTALSIADFFNAIGNFGFGIHNVLYYFGLVRKQMTPIKCMTRCVYIPMAEFGEAGSSTMVLMVSIDRLICVFSPNLYRAMGDTSRILYVLIGAAFFYSISDVLVSLVGSALMEQAPVPGNCFHVTTVPTFYYKWHVGQLVLTGYASILIYSVALLKLKYGNFAEKSKVGAAPIDQRDFGAEKSRDQHDLGTREDNSRNMTTTTTIKIKKMKREAAVTKRVSIIVLSTFLLQSFPMTLNLTALASNVWFSKVNSYVWMIFALTPYCNLLIYSMKIPDLAEGFKKIAEKICFFKKCETMCFSKT